MKRINKKESYSPDHNKDLTAERERDRNKKEEPVHN